MTAFSHSTPLTPSLEPAMLLVLLPPVGTGEGSQSATVSALLDSLQLQLGSTIRVLKINETTHPAVVRSFRAAQLPSFVLVQQGVELWRQQGLPEGEAIVPLLLSKLPAPPATAEATAVV